MPKCLDSLLVVDWDLLVGLVLARVMVVSVCLSMPKSIIFSTNQITDLSLANIVNLDIDWVYSHHCF